MSAPRGLPPSWRRDARRERAARGRGMPGGRNAVLAVLLLSAAPASADVIEIDPAGAVRTRGGVGEVVWNGGEEDRREDAAPDLPEGAVTPRATPLVPVDYEPALVRAAAAYDVSPSLLAALVWRESRWRHGAVSPKGALGLAQLMPGTARELAVDPRDPASNLLGGARYLRQQLDRFDGDVERALAAYNAGPGRVIRSRGIPAIAETRAYVAAIIDRLDVAAPERRSAR